MAHALLDYTVNTSAPAPPTGGGPVVPGPYSQASITAGAQVGTAPVTGAHNTILHCAGWGLAALGLLVLMHRSGFHLISVGRYGGR